MKKEVVGRVCIALGVGIFLTGALVVVTRYISSVYEHWLEMALWWSGPLWSRIFPAPPDSWVPSLPALICALATDVVVIAAICFPLLSPGGSGGKEE